MRYILSILLIGAALGAVAVGILGFQGRMSRKPPFELFPDMDRQAKLRPQEPNHFFPNGVSSQLAPEGTVARGTPIQTADGPVFGFENSPVNTGCVAGTTNFVETNPLAVNEALIRRGQDRFDGNGITKKLGVMPAVANLHDNRIVKLTDGEIFNTITHGKGVMGAVGPLLPTADRWAVVAYLRTLQLSWLGTTNDLSAAESDQLTKH